MIRAIVENILLFLLPTAAYIGYMVLSRRTAAQNGHVLSDAPLV
jgi:hypothetical protein